MIPAIVHFSMRILSSNSQPLNVHDDVSSCGCLAIAQQLCHGCAVSLLREYGAD